MKERIKRVINNHQMSCQINQQNLYILRGFKPIVDNIDIPVVKFDGETNTKDNRYILEEDWNGEKLEGFVPVVVNFNFFEGGLLNENGTVNSVKPLDVETLNVFNTNNPLIGVVDDLEMSDSQRLDYLKSIHIL